MGSNPAALTRDRVFEGRHGDSFDHQADPWPAAALNKLIADRPITGISLPKLRAKGWSERSQASPCPVQNTGKVLSTDRPTEPTPDGACRDPLTDQISNSMQARKTMRQTKQMPPMIGVVGCVPNHPWIGSVVLIFALLEAGCGSQGGGPSKGATAGMTSASSGGTNGSSPQGGRSASDLSAGAGGSGKSSSQGGGSLSGESSGKAGTSGSTSLETVTDLNGTQTIGSLSSSDAAKLCNDTYVYFGKTLSQADLCKWAGLAYAVSSSASSDSILQRNCKSQESVCLQAGPAAAKCDPIPASCSVTVAQYSACIADQADAFNKAIKDLPGCSTATLPDLEGVWNYMTGDLPDSCAPLSNKCPTYNIPAPRPGGSDSGAGGNGGGQSSSGGRSGSGSSTGTGGMGGTVGGSGGGARTGGVGGSVGGSGGGSGPSGTGGSTSAGGSTAAGGSTSPVARDGLPGDVAKAAGTPMVAAHAMTRALFASYTGPLFRALRDSDKQERDIGIVATTWRTVLRVFGHEPADRAGFDGA